MIKVVTFIFVYITFTSENVPEIKIEQGTLRGSFKRTLGGKYIASFTGIPFAKPPVGNLRFAAPIPAGPWEGILDATKNHAVCPQMNLLIGDHNIVGSEDCLFLNVHTPQNKSQGTRTLLPVMFFVHGGSWTSGSANNLTPDILLNHEIVLVTTNYRLSCLGFLSTCDNVLPGNNGLKDQNLALKWVKKNIVYFGGNPENIIICGNSAGAASVHFHTVSPLSKGLIKGAIIQSGSALSPWAMNSKETTLAIAKRFANFTNCPFSPTEAFVCCLRKLSAYELIAQETKYPVWSYQPLIPFRPVIENESKASFLPKEPADIIKSNESALVPIMTGVTTEEGAMSSAYMYNTKVEIEDLDSNFNKYAPLWLLYYDSKLNNEKFSKKLREFYFDDKKIDRSNIAAVTQAVTDVWFHLPAYNTIRLHFKYTKQNIYFYLFGYRGKNTTVTSMNNGTDPYDYGVSHSDELLYLFNSFQFDEKDKQMQEILSTLWTNFAKTGNPTPYLNGVIKTKWVPVKTTNFEYLFIKDFEKLEMRDNLNTKGINFWKDLEFNFRWKRFKDEL